MKTMTTAPDQTSASSTLSDEQERQQTEQTLIAEQANKLAIIEKLTTAWKIAVGKSFESTFACATVIHDAKMALDSESFRNWCFADVKISRSKADALDLIFNHANRMESVARQFDVQLPGEWTVLEQLAKIAAHAFTNIKANKRVAASDKAFKEVFAFMNTQNHSGGPEFPGVSSIKAKVNELLDVPVKEKKEKPLSDAEKAHQEKLIRDAEEAQRKADLQAAEKTPAVPDTATRTDISHAATAPLGDSPEPQTEPTPEEIADATADTPFFEETNDVEFLAFAAAYDKVLIANEIKAALRKFGVTNCEVVLRQKGEVA